MKFLQILIICIVVIMLWWVFMVVRIFQGWVSDEAHRVIAVCPKSGCGLYLPRETVGIVAPEGYKVTVDDPEYLSDYCFAMPEKCI